MAVHQREHSDDDAECSKSYFPGGRASIALRCCQLVLTVGTSMNNAGLTPLVEHMRELSFELIKKRNILCILRKMCNFAKAKRHLGIK